MGRGSLHAGKKKKEEEKTSGTGGQMVRNGERKRLKKKWATVFNGK